MAYPLVRQLSSLLVSNKPDQELRIISTPMATGEGSVYAEYRDELDDFVTVED